MRAALVCSFLVACAGPSQGALSETPAATTRRAPPLAPPASTDDRDRYQLNQQFEDMRDSQEAHREATHHDATPAPGPGSGSAAPNAAPGTARPVKHGPAEQAPDPVKPAPAPSR
ncbi:MAG: hypothetical protein ABIY55_22545 [Kofleriaceae bacterium]